MPMIIQCQLLSSGVGRHTDGRAKTTAWGGRKRGDGQSDDGGGEKGVYA
jgi:hypothetical protein